MLSELWLRAGLLVHLESSLGIGREHIHRAVKQDMVENV